MITRFIVVMGVAGSGKTSVGKVLADRLRWDFYDGDDFHSAENVAKMSNGIPLNDDDRRPWLESLHSLIATCLKEKRPGVLACSALKDAYRKILLSGTKGVEIVYLKGDYDLVWSRIAGRPLHYMKPEMLKSQFEALEEPAQALVVDASLDVDEIVAKIMQKF